MNKGLILAVVASVTLVGGLIALRLSGNEETAPVEPAEIAPPVLPYRPPPEPVMPPWSDEEAEVESASDPVRSSESSDAQPEPPPRA